MMMCVYNICDLPSEIIAIIVADLGKYEYYIGLNITCKSLSNLVSKFSLTKEMLNEFLRSLFRPSAMIVSILTMLRRQNTQCYIFGRLAH